MLLLSCPTLILLMSCQFPPGYKLVTTQSARIPGNPGQMVNLYVLYQVALVPHHLLAQAAQPLPSLQEAAGGLDEAVHVIHIRYDWGKAEQEVSSLARDTQSIYNLYPAFI